MLERELLDYHQFLLHLYFVHIQHSCWSCLHGLPTSCTLTVKQPVLWIVPEEQFTFLMFCLLIISQVWRKCSFTVIAKTPPFINEMYRYKPNYKFGKNNISWIHATELSQGKPMLFQCLAATSGKVQFFRKAVVFSPPKDLNPGYQSGTSGAISYSNASTWLYSCCCLLHGTAG